MRTIYAIPNYECNLSCPHCELKNNHIDYNEDAFLDSLNNLDDYNDYVILFGGEPTLYKDRFIKCIKSGKVKCISTNLLDIDDDILQHMKNYAIATSWNKTRFDDSQYHKWLSNLKQLAKNGKQCVVNITMTKDLVEDTALPEFFDVLRAIQDTNAVDKIQFEHYVGDYESAEYNEECDRWLCQLHYNWNFSMKNAIEDKLFDWNYDCSQTYTLQPNGNLTYGCPQYQRQTIIEKCLTCKNASICKPCKLHNACTFPTLLKNICSSKQ